MAFDYDVIILGGGSAGTMAASAASKAGARTLMVNDGELGGLCILRGCMPTKALLATAHALHEASNLVPFGARLEGRTVPDFAAIMDRKDALVLRFQNAKIRNIESDDYEVLDAGGRFTPDGAVDVGGRTLRARAYVIATGSYPSVLPLPGVEQVPVWNSDDVMRLREQPKRLLVQGAGPIGLELAQFFARIGTEVLVVNRSGLLSRIDVECGSELRAAFDEEPRLDLAIPGTIVQLRPHGTGLVATIETEGEHREFEADALLMATGRSAAIEGLRLEHVGVDAAENLIRHDDSMRTTNPDIYVAGDATGTYQILHLSNQEGAVAGHNAAVGGAEHRMDYRLKMSVIFTDPPFATVGMTEREARDAGHDVVVGQARFPETGRAITMETRHGVWRLFVDRESGQILGSAAVGPRVDDLIHGVMLLMHHRTPVEAILDLPWYHPTLSEVMLNLARDVQRQR